MAVHIVRHPLVQHKLGLLRMSSTGTREFRTLANEIAGLLIYEATQRLPTEKRVVQGWAGPVEVEAISGKKTTVVPILRAGLGLMDGVLDMIPGAKISVVGLYRNEETLDRWNTMSNWPAIWNSGLPLCWIPCWRRAVPCWPRLIC